MQKPVHGNGHCVPYETIRQAEADLLGRDRARDCLQERLENLGVVWLAIRDGVMSLNHAQFEALFAGLDWRRVRTLSARCPAEAE